MPQETLLPPPELHPPPVKKRMRRSAELFDAEGNPVHIRLTCLCCKGIKPLASFGLRKMSNGTVRNQPWCRSCRSTKNTTAKPSAANPTEEKKDREDKTPL